MIRTWFDLSELITLSTVGQGGTLFCLVSMQNQQISLETSTLFKKPGYFLPL